MLQPSSLVEFLPAETGKYLHIVQRFDQVGAAIASARPQELRNLEDKIREFQQRPAPSPFVALDVSSGNGKTQLAFALRQFKTIYLPLTGGRVLGPVIESESQEIYLAFERFSIAVNQAIWKDVTTYTTWTDDLAIEEAITLADLATAAAPLWTAGLIAKLAELVAQDDRCGAVALAHRAHLQYSPLTVTEFMVKMLPYRNMLVMWDEPASYGHTAARLTSFARNLVRHAGLVPIMMGLDCSMADIDVRLRPGVRDPALSCAYVCTTLPPTNYAAIVDSELGGKDPFSDHPNRAVAVAVLGRCRPLVAVVALRHAAAGHTWPGILTAIADGVARHSIGGSQDRRRQFMVGQAALLMPHYREAVARDNMAREDKEFMKPYNVYEDRFGNTALVCAHLASLFGNPHEIYARDADLRLVSLIGNRALCGFRDSGLHCAEHRDSAPWRGFCHYPPREALLWLALCLLPSQVGATRVTLRSILHHSQSIASVQLVYQPRDACTLLPGSKLKALVCAGALRASHGALVGGTPATEFLLKLMHELSVPCPKFDAENLEQVCPALADIRVPFLLPPSIPEAAMAELRALFQVDYEAFSSALKADGLSATVAIETIDNATALDLEALKGSVVRLAEHARPLSILVCEEMHDHYFVGGAWSWFEKLRKPVKTALSRTAVLRASGLQMQSDGSVKVTLEQVFDVPRPKGQKVDRVIVVLPLFGVVYRDAWPWR
eukprot:m.102608 g.102608  ORF g.102608 m.102608 type:complete len:722 (-) comp8829_c2_seq2:1203-3368(-)